MIERFRPQAPALTIEQAHDAMNMESLGMSAIYIADQFNITQAQLIVTLYWAKRYGFVYFAYCGELLEYIDLLSALGAKLYGVGVYKQFIDRTGSNMSKGNFSRSLNLVKPYL